MIKTRNMGMKEARSDHQTERCLRGTPYVDVMPRARSRPERSRTVRGGGAGAVCGRGASLEALALIIKPRDSVTRSESKRTGLTCLEQGTGRPCVTVSMFIRTGAERQGQGHPRNPGVRG